jgi:hypothetical protein
MSGPLLVPELLEAWREWAEWTRAHPGEGQPSDLIGWMEFNWVVEDYPEQAWSAILAALEDPRMEASLEVLAAGPLEDLLSLHGETFISRVEEAARSNQKFAWLLGGVWQFQMSDDVWKRVQAVWDRRGWDGIAQGAS